MIRCFTLVLMFNIHLNANPRLYPKLTLVPEVVDVHVRRIKYVVYQRLCIYKGNCRRRESFSCYTFIVQTKLKTRIRSLFNEVKT